MDNYKNKKQALKEIILALHAKKPLADLQKRFQQEFGSISPDFLANIEQELIDNGEVSIDQVTELCNLHVEAVAGLLNQSYTIENVPPGHPVHTLIEENRFALNLIINLEKKVNPSDLIKLAAIEHHYLRLENELFPVLEKYNFSGPSKVMWAKHDQIRDMLKNRDQVPLSALLNEIREMIRKEQDILLPTALKLLKITDWIRIRKGEDELGYRWIQPGTEWQFSTTATIHSQEKKYPVHTEEEKVLSQMNKKQELPVISVSKAKEQNMEFDTGKLSLEQANWILKTLPVDLSFINADDEVQYYSDSPDRIFPRSPGVIGRKVINCHPPKSHHIVQRILDAFRSNTKDSAEFWLPLGEKFVQIRYFAIRNSVGVYLGCLEVSQDITQIKTLEGKHTLLDWE